MRTTVAKQKRPHPHRETNTESLHSPRTPTPNRSSSISILQRTAGNHAVGQFLQSECDVGNIKRSSSTPPIELDVAGLSVPTIDTSSIVHQALSSPGQLLPVSTQQEMEARFGHDFSQVRIHTDSRAAESARSVGAVAYTVGQDVVFGKDGYAPNSHKGRQLLTHELAHVAQDAAGRGNGESSMLEAEADRAAAYAPMLGQPQQHVRVGGQVLHRKPLPGPDPDIEFMLILALD